MDGGAPKKRRRRWRHKVWEEGKWGEQAEREGAATVSTGEHTAEKPHTPTREPAAHGRSRIPEEDSLRQLQLTGFLTPASHGGDRPSMENGAANSMGEEISTTKQSSGGSPCLAEREARSIEIGSDKPFEEGVGGCTWILRGRMVTK